MKRNLKPIVLTLTTACLAFSANAEHNDGRFYLRADVGGTWGPDADLKEYFGPVTPGSEVEFDPGFRFGATAGYDVTEWFAAEGQLGVMAANIRSITDADRVDAVFSNVPLLVNAKFQWPSRCPFTPYIGGGAGLSIASIGIEEIDLNGTSVEGTDADAVFGYQGFAGIRYRLNDNMDLGLEYRYFGTTAPSWEAENLSGEIRFGCIETHAVSFTFTYRF
jgi:opacity protein-like surface antigen